MKPVICTDGTLQHEMLFFLDLPSNVLPYKKLDTKIATSCVNSIFLVPKNFQQCYISSKFYPLISEVQINNIANY